MIVNLPFSILSQNLLLRLVTNINYNFIVNIGKGSIKMEKIKDIIAMEKQNMPDYQFKFLYHRVMPGFIFVLGGAIISLGLGSG